MLPEASVIVSFRMVTFRRLLFLVAALQLVSSLQLTEKKINDVITLTLVHDGEDAMMMHSEAIAFCKNISSNKLLHPVVPDDSYIENIRISLVLPTAAISSPLVTEAMNPTISPEHLPATDMPQSDLLSIHDPGMVAELMQWILNVERRQFWIGGMIRKVVGPFEDNIQHIIHVWSDRTPTNFRFLHFPNDELVDLPMGDVRCLSVDFASGKWGVHECEEKMYFVCATITPPTHMEMADGVEMTTPLSTQTPVVEGVANMINEPMTTKTHELSSETSTKAPAVSASTTAQL